MRYAITTTFILASAAIAISGERDARACGGCFHPPNENPTVVTDHRMIVSISPQQTTLYDQVRYEGDPSSFAWVLPITGTVTVGLSADALFAVLDGVSHTTIVAPESSCPAPACNANNAAAANHSAPQLAPNAGDVAVSHEQVVGPYETVQLHSTDPNALNNWLTQHGYAVPPEEAPIIAAYVKGHFDFLALKLVPGQGVSAMRPVRVTTPGASLTLPLRMVAAGAGAMLGVTLWVVADGRYEPQNFPWFHVEDADLVWDWAAQRSNYTTVRAAKEEQLANRAWEVESSTMQDIVSIENQLRGQSALFGSNASSPEYPPVPADDAGNPGQSSQEQFDADTQTLFAGIGAQFRLTRLRADLAQCALTADLFLQASSDQGTLSTDRHPRAQINAPACPSIPSQCGGVGGGVASGVSTGQGPNGAGSNAAGGAPPNAALVAGGCAIVRDTGAEAFAWLGLGGAAIALVFTSARRRRERAPRA